MSESKVEQLHQSKVEISYKSSYDSGNKVTADQKPYKSQKVANRKPILISKSQGHILRGCHWFSYFLFWENKP